MLNSDILSLSKRVWVVNGNLYFSGMSLCAETYPAPYDNFRKYYASVISRTFWLIRVRLILGLFWLFLDKIGLVRLERLMVPVSLVTDLWSDNYYHFMLETLPRCLRAKEKFGTQAKVAISERLYQKRFIQQALNALGVCVYLLPVGRWQRPVILEKAHIIQQAEVSGKPSPNDVKAVHAFLRELTIKKPSKNQYQGKILYTQRGKGEVRQWSNQELCQGVLNCYGVKTVVWSQFDWIDQISIAAHASGFLGVHGANLVNMMAMPAGSWVIEILPKRDDGTQNQCYQYLAEILGHRYVELTPFEQIKSLGDGGDDDVVVAPEDISQELEKICQKKEIAV